MKIQGTYERSELERALEYDVVNKRYIKPHGASVRYRYIVNVSFQIRGNLIRAYAVVDTGAQRTVISRSAFGDKTQLIDDMSCLGKSKLSGFGKGTVDVGMYVVDNFKLTNEISFKHIKIGISDSEDTTSVLGMDILGLFSFMYEIRGGNMIGTMYIINYTEQLKRIESKYTNKTYIDSDKILVLNDEPDLTIVGRNINKSHNRTVGYFMINKKGKKFYHSIPKVMDLANQKRISNATIVTLKDKRKVLRGKGCKLSGIPVYTADYIHT